MGWGGVRGNGRRIIIIDFMFFTCDANKNKTVTRNLKEGHVTLTYLAASGPQM